MKTDGSPCIACQEGAPTETLPPEPPSSGDTQAGRKVISAGANSILLTPTPTVAGYIDIIVLYKEFQNSVLALWWQFFV